VKDRILLFIPGYNCEKQIIRVLNQVNEEVMNYIAEVIVVNNISTDKTEMIVSEYINKNSNFPIKLLTNNDNYGLGGSHKVAFEYAINHNFDYIIVLHGDDQGDIKDILPILKNGNYKNYDCCLGARFMKDSRIKGYSKMRILGNKVYNKIFSLALQKKIYDLGSGLNIYNINMLKNRFYIKFPDDLVFNDCMILASGYYNHNIKFFPITWREDDQVSNVKMFNICSELLMMVIKYSFNKEKYIKSEHRKKANIEYKANLVCKNKY